MLKTRPVICFEQRQTYPLFSKKYHLKYTGVSVQTFLLLRRLCLEELQYDIKLLSGNYGQGKSEFYDCVEVIRGASFFRKDSIFVVFIKALLIFYRFLQVRPRILVQRGNNLTCFLLVLYSWLFWDARTIFIIDSDLDVDGTFEKKKPVFSRLYHYSLRCIDKILVVSPTQKDLLAKRYGVDATVIGNGVCVEKSVLMEKVDYDMVWVGTLDPEKNPEAILLLSQKLRNKKILVLCRKGSDESLNQLFLDEFKKNEMIDVKVNVSYPEMMNSYDARLLINTSPKEGLPNAFLEAGSRGIPIVSLWVDPCKLLGVSGVGISSDGSIEVMAKNIMTLLSDVSLYERYSEAIYSKVLKDYSINAVAEKFIKICKIPTRHN